MSDEHKRSSNLDCVEFQERMPDLFETNADFSKEKHLEDCENCAELVRDMEYIAAQAKLLMPMRDPSPAVWENILTALQPGDGERG